MKQIRFQPLEETYNQLRSDLCKTALSIQSTDYTSAAAWLQLIQQAAKTLTAYKRQAAKEEAILFPILHSYEPALVAILRDEQNQRTRYLDAVYTLLKTMHAATDKHKSILFSHKLLYRFNEFVAATLQQLNEQERMINEVLWRYYNDVELMQMAASFHVAATVQPQSETVTTKWVYKRVPSTPNLQTAAKPRIAGGAPVQRRAASSLELAI